MKDESLLEEIGGSLLEETGGSLLEETGDNLLEETGDNLLEEKNNPAESENTTRQKQLIEQLQKELEAAQKQREEMERRTQELEAERKKAAEAPTTNTQATQPTSAPLLEETGDNLLEENSNTAKSEKTARQKQLMEQLQKELEAAKKQREKMERRTQELVAERTSFNPTRPIPNSTRTTSTHVKTPWYKQWYTWISAAVFAGLLYIGFANSDSNTDDGDAVRTEMVVSTAINRLEGNYTLREKNTGVSVNGIRTAAIKKTSESQAKILVSTEYGPELYDFTLNTSGQIESEQLGKGEITYNEKLDKITLTFKQGERICEFTK